MSIVLKALLVSFVTWLAVMDKDFLSTFFYRPICVGPVIGLIFGNLQCGLEVGVALELMFLAMVYVGTAIPPDEILSCSLATAFACMSGGDAQIGIAMAMPVAIIGEIMRQFRTAILFTWTNMRMEKCIEEGKTPWGITLYAVIIPVIINYLMFGLPVFFAINNGADAVLEFINMIPEKVIAGVSAGGGLIGAVGVALLLQSISVKKMWPFFIVGFFFVAYLGVNMIAVAIIALFCVAIYYVMTESKHDNLS